MAVELMQHQYDFVTDTETRYLGLIGGYGSGKTKAFCYKAIHMASLNVGYTGALLEPIGNMITDVLIPELEQCLQEAGVAYKFKASPLPVFTLYFKRGKTTLLLRSGENYRRLAGLNLAFFGVDECDTISTPLAWKMWRMLQSRLRRGKVYQGFTTSTPEGFGFLYEFFVKSGKDQDRGFIKARTEDNPFLPEDFIESLRENYPEELIKAYLEGEFVNLTSGRIYYKFDRALNNSDLTLDQLLTQWQQCPLDMFGNRQNKPELHIGMDFNINKMSAIVHVIDTTNGPTAIDEIVGARDTEQIIDLIKERYDGWKINVYPDSSGANRDTANASITDISLLKSAGFSVYAGNKNPFVKDRINSMNVLFCNSEGIRRYHVNTKTCPTYTMALEQQVYDKFGQPDKAHDQDHPNDASGYFVHWKFPVKRYTSGSIKMVGM